MTTIEQNSLNEHALELTREYQKKIKGKGPDWHKGFSIFINAPKQIVPSTEEYKKLGLTSEGGDTSNWMSVGYWAALDYYAEIITRRNEFYTKLRILMEEYNAEEGVDLSSMGFRINGQVW